MRKPEPIAELILNRHWKKFTLPKSLKRLIKKEKIL